MSGPFKMRGFSGFGNSPLEMYGGSKSSPAKSWWNRMFGKKTERSVTTANAAVDEAGGGMSTDVAGSGGQHTHTGEGGGAVQESGVGGERGNWLQRVFGGGGMDGGDGGGGRGRGNFLSRLFGGGGRGFGGGLFGGGGI